MKKALHLSDLNQRYGSQFDKLQLFPVYFSPLPVLLAQKHIMRLLSSFLCITEVGSHSQYVGSS